MANIIFEKISEYSFMHSSSQVTEALIKAVEICLPSIGGYMESRLKSVDHCFHSKTQKKINKKVMKKCPGMGRYGFIRTPIWAPEDEIKSQMFKSTGSMQPMQMQFLDIPLVYSDT